MQIIPSLLNPNAEIMQKAMDEHASNLNIANEIYLAKRCTKIHYADNMDGLPEELASKSMLVNWLNDYMRNGAMLRNGLLRAYQNENREHFTNEVWQSYYFPSLVQFIAKSMVDVEIVGTKKKAQLFAQSFEHEEWVEKASSVIGLKMLERLYIQNRLTSRTARAILRLNFHARELLVKQNRGLGRHFKNHDISHSLYPEYQDDMEHHFKEAIQMVNEEFMNDEENRVYEEYKNRIHGAIKEGITEALNSSTTRLVALHES